MAQGGASGYAAINARVRVMYSTLLTPDEYIRLNEAPDMPVLIGLLQNTPYGPYLEQSKEKSLSPRRAVFQIEGRLADSYTSIIRGAPAHARPLLRQLYRRFELKNLKAILRGIVGQASWDQVRYVLFPLGDFSELPAQEMMEAGSVAAAVELLRDTPYYEVLSFAMKRYSLEQNLFALEVAIDLDYWRHLWREVNVLPQEDRVHAVKIIGALVDMNNLMWAIRYRVFHKLSEEELINYTLPFGAKVHDEDIRAIAAGVDFGQVVGRIYPDMYTGDWLTQQDPQEKLNELERKLQLHLIAVCRAAFVGDPFQIGIPLAYLILSEMEMEDLIVLIEAKAQKLARDAYQHYVLMNLSA